MPLNPLLFVDFDVSNAGTAGPTSWATWQKHAGIFHNNGVATQDQSVAPPAAMQSGSLFFTGRTSNSNGFGNDRGGFQAGSGTSPTYSAVNSAKGYQCAAKRSTWGIGSEVWVTMDLIWPSWNANLSGAIFSNKHFAIFRWGDVEVWLKSFTITSGSTGTIVLSIRNNGSEIATISIPNINEQGGAFWSFLKVHVKLDSSTGLIDVTCDGVAQSASYTGQNTVATTSLASADHVYFGPPMLDTGTGLYGGGIDNVYFDGSGFPTGRPRGERIALNGDDTLSSWAAEGTSPSTVVNALSDPTDAKAARGSGSGASALLTLASYSTSGLDSQMIGWNLYAKRVSNRDPNTTRKLSVGISVSGTPTMDTLVVGSIPPADNVSTPPANAYSNLAGVVYNNNGSNWATTDIANSKLRLLATT